MKTLPAVIYGVSLWCVISTWAEAQPIAANQEIAIDVKPADALDWTLGPTGMRGWIRSADGATHDARQIQVTKVAEGSPAAGVLNVGDVILGVDGKHFSTDARRHFADAITAAEAAQGELRVVRLRAGKSENVIFKLPVLGKYSATTPYDCSKSQKILELGCASLAKRMPHESYARQVHAIPRSLNALALLASGKAEYLPQLKREANWAADFTTDGYLSWHYGYVMSFLGEYIIATGDQSVLPGLKRLALETARGQSGVGTWGHRFAVAGGTLQGYGAMNQPGLSLTIGMVLAREAGVNEPEVDRAIAKASSFLRWFLYKGAIPYGDHLPFPGHEDNGKCAAAAVLFDLLGDREASEFFAKMSVAAYSERERGHTGNYFNYVWAMLGVARCGPLATGAYWQEQSWYYDLARTWEMSWIYQASPVGAEEHKSYTGWDCSGNHLLGYALPLRSLRLTGKKPFTVPPLNATQVAELIAAGRDFAYRRDADPYDQRSTEQLFAGLSSWSPFVRQRSAAALGRREGDFVPTLQKLLASSDRDTRYGAAEALGTLGARADVAAAELRAALQDKDPWLQSLAAEAIPGLSPAARQSCVSDLLAMTVRTNPADPRHMIARSAGIALFSRYPGTRGPKSLLSDSLDGVDRELLYPAIRTLLKHEDSVSRSALSGAIGKLTDDDLIELLPDIVKAIEQPAPSGEMFADGIRLAGLDLLSRLQIREGMALGVALIEPDRWGERNRTGRCLMYLQRYGTNAKQLLPQLRQIRKYLAEVKKFPADKLAEFDKAVAAIESSTATPTLVSITEFRARSSTN
jgi:HEAT repeat protein